MTEQLVFVNVFSCEPDQQNELVNAIQYETDDLIRGLPGFLSATIHASLDGCRVANYAAWERVDDFHRFLQSERGLQMLRTIHAHTSDIDVHLYRVISTHVGDAEIEVNGT